MALANLASTSDLTARGIDTSQTALVNTLLAVASATIRRAAGSPILTATSTVTVWASDESAYLRLPGLPVRSVATVVRDGVTLAASDYKLVDGRLWRSCGWGYCNEPISVVVTMTHGLATVPADIVDLTCSLVGAGLGAAAEGYAGHAGIVAELDGDYQVTYTRGAEAVATAMELPVATRRYLRANFGGGVAVVSYS